MENVAVIQAIYEAFGRGDVPAVLERVTEDTVWSFNGARQEVPWHRPVRGRREVPGFFQSFGGNQMHSFEPRKFIAQGEDVIVHVVLAYTVPQTGKRVAEEQLHWWTLRDGKVARLTHFEDTAQVAAAVTH